MTQIDTSSPVRVEHVTKDFAAVRALDDVTLALRPGEVHGLVGENGAGKSTLMKILAGVEQPTSGTIYVADEPVLLKHPIDAQRRGIVMIYQELNLVEALSVADNIALGRERLMLWRIVNRRATERQARELLASLDCGHIDPRASVRSLSIANRQMVEIAKALSYRARVLIMDEPTAVLTRRETEVLFRVVRRLRESGVTIIYISHLLPEVLGICDRITVMRDGRIVETLDEERTKRTTERELAGPMVGRTMSEHFPPRARSADPITALEVLKLEVPGRVRDVSFEVRRGEILGFAGLIGAGRTELAEAVSGLRPRSSGTIRIDGRAVEIDNPRAALRAGIAYLSEDRKGTGLTLGMGVAENVTLPSLRQFARPLIDRRAEDRVVAEHVRNLRIRVSRPRQFIDTLSGGNQQKVALAKWLETRPKVLILDEPTRGVDIGAKEEIYHLVHRLAREGMACMFISSELNEVLGMCHRIAVMRRGRLMTILDGASATEKAVMNIAAGVESQLVHP
jgi:ribose transport system ATP-binding protein